MPKYKIEIGLKGDTIEHEKEVNASNLNDAYSQAHDWAVEEYCITQATPLDKDGELAEELDALAWSIRSVVLTMKRSGYGPNAAQKFIEHMSDHISRSIDQVKDDMENLTAPGPEH